MAAFRSWLLTNVNDALKSLRTVLIKAMSRYRTEHMQANIFFVRFPKLATFDWRIPICLKQKPGHITGGSGRGGTSWPGGAEPSKANWELNGPGRPGEHFFAFQIIRASRTPLSRRYAKTKLYTY